jgi:hypothetical protein
MEAIPFKAAIHTALPKLWSMVIENSFFSPLFEKMRIKNTAV